MPAFAVRFLVAVLFGGIVTGQSGVATDVWAPVRFLIGTWEGEVNGQPGKGQSEREYRFVLNSRFLEMHNKSVYPIQPGNPKGEVHEDYGMISYDRSRRQLVLRQFHVEGFVNQYAAVALREGVLRFTSESIENIPAGFRARETYTVTGPDTFTELFEIAEPGKEFEVYDETHFRRRK
jgi:hypothetical protein